MYISSERLESTDKERKSHRDVWKGIKFSLVQKLKSIRKNQQITQQQMELKTGIQCHNICQIENGGRSVSFETLSFMAEKLGWKLEIKLKPKGVDYGSSEDSTISR